MHINLHILDYVSLRSAPFAVSFRGRPFFNANLLFPELGFPDVQAATAHLFGGHWEMGESIDHVLVTESGVYALLLVSPIPEAKIFRQWVSGTVLPAIRKDGGYVLGEAATSPQEVEKPIPLGIKRRLLDEIIPALQADGVYVDDEGKVKKGRMTRAEFSKLVRDVVREKWAVVD